MVRASSKKAHQLFSEWHDANEPGSRLGRPAFLGKPFWKRVSKPATAAGFCFTGSALLGILLIDTRFLQSLPDDPNPSPESIPSQS
jgi:hypothetical protein